MTLWKRVTLSFAAFAALAGLTACLNVFDPIDNPGGDEQILSAARAAFDKGNMAEARELYSKLGGNETAISEKIFLDLDTCGADIGAFGSALVNGINSAGLVLTVMGEKMARSHSTACFATLLAAYKSSLTLSDPNIKGFTSLLAALAIAGEVVGHNSGAQDGTLRKADFVVASSCTNLGGAACSGGGACVVSDGITASAAVTLSSATTIDASWGTVQGAFSAANTALGLLNISTGPTLQLITATGLSGQSANNDNYRCALNAIGVGR